MNEYQNTTTNENKMTYSTLNHIYRYDKPPTTGAYQYQTLKNAYVNQDEIPNGIQEKFCNYYTLETGYNEMVKENYSYGGIQGCCCDPPSKHTSGLGWAL